MLTLSASLARAVRQLHVGLMALFCEQTRRTSSCSRVTNLRWPLMWILLFSLFGTGCAESLQKSNEDMTMQILIKMFLMTCTTLMFTLIRAFTILISCFRGRSWCFGSIIELLNQQAVCLFSAAWPCVKAFLVTLWGVKVVYPHFGVWIAICCMFCGTDLLHVLWNLAHWKAKRFAPSCVVDALVEKDASRAKNAACVEGICVAKQISSLLVVIGILAVALKVNASFQGKSLSR